MLKWRRVYEVIIDALEVREEWTRIVRCGMM